jgi:hypothetical protein
VQAHQFSPFSYACTHMKSTTRPVPTSTVGRGKTLKLSRLLEDQYVNVGGAHLYQGDSLKHYASWPTPSVIVSDGGYGILGFEGDTSDHLDLPHWYEPHVAAWSAAIPDTATLWFWNSEIGWAAVHPVLERHGWRYVNCNIWDKGKGHIAGNVNTQKIRRFPVVTEVCVQYVKEVRIAGLTLKEWLKAEWARSGRPFREANEACGVKDAAVRKYLDQGHLWYYPPPEAFAQLSAWANEKGSPEGRPYFSRDGKRPMTKEEWAHLRTVFHCPHGHTNVWSRHALRGFERIKINGNGGPAAHLNQKPLDLMELIINASSDHGDVIWEPFGGLFTASIAAARNGRISYASEMDPMYFTAGVERVRGELSTDRLI